MILPMGPEDFKYLNSTFLHCLSSRSRSVFTLGDGTYWVFQVALIWKHFLFRFVNTYNQVTIRSCCSESSDYFVSEGEGGRDGEGGSSFHNEKYLQQNKFYFLTVLFWR